MSRGTPIRHFRMTDADWQEMLDTVQLRNHFTREEHWDKSAFITLAIREKIAKMERSRGGRKAGTVLAELGLAEQLPEPDVVQKSFA